MNPVKLITGFMGWTGFAFLATILTFIAWFIPWVFTFYLGLIAYFPYEPDGQSRYLRVNGPVAGWVSDRWTPSDSIPGACKTALVASEDSGFYQHHGIDIESMQKSYKFNQRRKKIRRGGSTITQQLVKNAFLSRDRSYFRKAREITGAVLLDVIMPKDLQLTWYLNIVEYGPNIYGLNDAARFYFSRGATELTPSQCIALVSVLPGPNKWGSSLRKHTLSSFMQSRYRTILSRMILMGLTARQDISFARTTAPFGRKPLPAKAIPTVRDAAQNGVEAAMEFQDSSDDDVAKSTERGEDPNFDIETYSPEPASGMDSDLNKSPEALPSTETSTARDLPELPPAEPTATPTSVPTPEEVEP
jgi:monofunctional biosynthetic peptidoglycan transglycosylase